MIHKRLVPLIIVMAAMLGAVPLTANAAEITYPAGTRAAIGQIVEMTGTNVTLTTVGVGPISCGVVNLKFEVTKNNGIELDGSGSNAKPTQESCYNEEKARLATITDFNLTKIYGNGPNGPSGSTKSGTMSFTVTVDLPKGIVCRFTGTNVPYTYVSTASPAVITFNKGSGITSTGGCGNATLDATFVLHGPSVTAPVVLH